MLAKLSAAVTAAFIAVAGFVKTVRSDRPADRLYEKALEMADRSEKFATMMAGQNSELTKRVEAMEDKLRKLDEQHELDRTTWRQREDDLLAERARHVLLLRQAGISP